MLDELPLMAKRMLKGKDSSSFLFDQTFSFRKRKSLESHFSPGFVLFVRGLMQLRTYVSSSAVQLALSMSSIKLALLLP
jgi:hypothetical protein